jgi:hypothetical protein
LGRILVADGRKIPWQVKIRIALMNRFSALGTVEIVRVA